MLLSDAAVDEVRENAEVRWKVPTAVAALALYYAEFGVALATLSARRVVAGATILGVLLVSFVVWGILEAAEGTGAAQAGALNLLHLPLYVRDLVFLGRLEADSPLGGVAGGAVLAAGAYLVVVAASVGVLLWRYRWADQ